MSTNKLKDFRSGEISFAFEGLEELPQGWVRSVTIAVESVMPTLNAIVCAWKLLQCPIEHVPKFYGVHWRRAYCTC